MTQLNDFFEANLAAVVAVIALVFLLLLVVILVQMARVRRLNRRLDSLTRGADGRNLESVFSAHLETVLSVARDLDAVRTRTSAIEAAMAAHLQRFALVRFNPFEDTGGNQSFALALLDAADNGIVVSSLHSRTGTRVYAKEVKAGRAETALSAEEAQALERAAQGRGAALPAPAVATIARPSVAQATARFAPAALDGSDGGRGVPNGESAIDARFIDPRLRGEDEEPRLWGDRTR